MNLKLGAFLFFVLPLAACAFDSEAQTSAASEDEIRSLKANEYVGFLEYGDEVVASYTAGSTTYRAYRFRANAYDRIEVTLTAETPDTAIWATLLDEDGNDLTPSTSSGVASRTIRYTMPNVFAERTLVFRESTRKTTNVRIKLASTGIREPASAFSPVAGSYSAPPSLANAVHDVLLRCQDTRYQGEGEWSWRPSSEAETTGMVSLDLGGKSPKVVGTDGALGAPAGKAEYGLDAAFLSATKQSANTITLTVPKKSGYEHRLQLSNTGSDEVRVEYSLTAHAGNVPIIAQTLSCVGVLKK